MTVLNRTLPRSHLFFKHNTLSSATRGENLTVSIGEIHRQFAQVVPSHFGISVKTKIPPNPDCSEMSGRGIWRFLVSAFWILLWPHPVSSMRVWWLILRFSNSFSSSVLYRDALGQYLRALTISARL